MDNGSATGALIEITRALAAGRAADASRVAANALPFQPRQRSGRKYSRAEMLAVFGRDSFTDRYRGSRLIHPGALRLLHHLMPDQFPFDPHGRYDICHDIFWTLLPTVDHVVPQAKGGVDDESNWVTCSMATNQAKGNWTLEEVGWTLVPVDRLSDWDGLAGWFVSTIDAHRKWLSVPYLRDWYRTTRKELNELALLFP